MGRYIVDFYCPRAKLIVEIDGGQHAFARQSAADAERTRWLEAQGYKVIRFWTNEIMNELDAVCAAIIAASHGEWPPPLPKPAPPVSTSPQGGG
jgi:very-short-patch-repair endonuclease